MLNGSLHAFLKDLGRNDTGLMSTLTATTEEELSAGQLYPITLEFRENYGAAEAHLSWQSDSQPIEVCINSFIMDWSCVSSHTSRRGLVCVRLRISPAASHGNDGKLRRISNQHVRPT